MMRPGDKLASYRLLGQALERLLDLDWQLLVVGDGPARPEVEAALAPLGAERVCYLGRLEEGAVAACYAAADLCLWPAVNEAYGMALLEAQAAGLPVIAGAVGGVPSIVVEGVTGLLTPPGETNAFAAAACALIEAPARRAAMAGAAAENVRRRHDIAAAARVLDRALAEACAEGPEAMALLALLRHGPTSWTAERRLQGRTDLPLSPEGRQTVGRWRLADDVAGFHWLSSPLRRARETAALLGHAEAPVEAQLIEMSFGEWEGRRLRDLRAELGPVMVEVEGRGLDFRAPGGESPREVQARILPLLAEFGRDGRDRLAVTHKAVIRAIYALATGWPMLGEPPERLADFALHIYALAEDGTPSLRRLNLPLDGPRCSAGLPMTRGSSSMSSICSASAICAGPPSSPARSWRPALICGSSPAGRRRESSTSARPG